MNETVTALKTLISAPAVLIALTIERRLLEEFTP